MRAERRPRQEPEQLLTFGQCAERTATTERLWRELVATRRVRSVKVGKYRRIPESALVDFIEANTCPAAVQRPLGVPAGTMVNAPTMPLRRRRAFPMPPSRAQNTPTANVADHTPDAS